MRLQLIEGNWDFIFAHTVTAVGAGDDSYHPIPDFESSTLEEGRVIAVYASSNNSPDTHHLAGWVKQIIRTGISVGGTVDAVGLTAKYWFNKNTLIYLPEVAAEWSLSFSVPYWVQNQTVNVHLYTGPITERYDQILSEIKTAVIP